MSEFKKIKGFSQYEITKDGIIRMTVSLHVVKMRIHSKYGYKMCTIFDDNLIQRTVYPHKEVAKAFIKTTKSGKLYVIHLNGDKTDNRVENLKWATVAEVHLHQLRIGQRKTLGNPEIYKSSKNWIAKHAPVFIEDAPRPKRNRIKIKKVFSAGLNNTSIRIEVYEKPTKRKELLFNI
jgi:hypothetical protein